MKAFSIDDFDPSFCDGIPHINKISDNTPI